MKYDAGLFYAPYVPFTKNTMAEYRLLKKIQDVDGMWYSVQIYSSNVADWLINHSDGWRYTAKNYPGWTDYSLYDIREDVYTWFVLRWGGHD